MEILRLAHRWLGLALAAVVLVVSVTGGLLLLRDPYLRWAYPAAAEPRTEEQAAARADVLAAIEARWAGEGVRLVKLPQPGVNVFHVWLLDGSEAIVHATTGAVIDRWGQNERLPAVVFDLHAHLFAGHEGEIVNGFVALLLVFMGLTGLVLWWPRRRTAFRLRGVLPRRRTRAGLLRSHAAVGVLAAAPILLFAATGAGLVFYGPVSAVAGAMLDARQAEEPRAIVRPQPAPVQAWARILDAVDRALGPGDTVFYSPGSADNARLMFRKRMPGEWHPNGRSYVLVNPYTAEVVQAIDARAQGRGTRAMQMLYPLHAAKVGGAAMVLLAALSAASLAWLALGGGWAYLEGFRVAAATRGRRSQRPAETTPRLQERDA